MLRPRPDASRRTKDGLGAAVYDVLMMPIKRVPGAIATDQGTIATAVFEVLDAAPLTESGPVVPRGMDAASFLQAMTHIARGDRPLFEISADKEGERLRPRRGPSSEVLPIGTVAPMLVCPELTPSFVFTYGVPWSKTGNVARTPVGESPERLDIEGVSRATLVWLREEATKAVSVEWTAMVDDFLFLSQAPAVPRTEGLAAFSDRGFWPALIGAIADYSAPSGASQPRR